LRGPARSSQVPNTAADRPRKTIAMLKIQAIGGWVQSSAVAVVMPRIFVIGSLKTLNA
jgi:hypothetical protein